MNDNLDLSLTIIICGMDCCIIYLWLYCIRLSKVREIRFYSVGNWLYAISYLPLICKYIYLYITFVPDKILTSRLTWASAIIQLAAMLWFVSSFRFAMRMRDKAAQKQ